MTVDIESIISQVLSSVTSGKTVEKAVDEAWSSNGLTLKIYEETKAEIYKSINKELGVSAVRSMGGIDSAYSTLMKDNDIRAQIVKSSQRMKADIVKQVKSSIKNAKGIWETSRDIRNVSLLRGADTGGVIEQGLKKLYSTSFQDQAKVIERRLKAGIKSEQLKYSYDKLLTEIEKDGGTGVITEELLKQQAYTLRNKIRNNAERIAKTEKSRAINAARVERYKNDEDVKLVKVVLEKRSHHIEDICDVVCSADCGYGKGVYPLNKSPMLPLHPNCNCRLMPVYNNNGKQIKSVTDATNDVKQDIGILDTDIKYQSIK